VVTIFMSDYNYGVEKRNWNLSWK